MTQISYNCHPVKEMKLCQPLQKPHRSCPYLSPLPHKSCHNLDFHRNHLFVCLYYFYHQSRIPRHFSLDLPIVKIPCVPKPPLIYNPSSHRPTSPAISFFPLQFLLKKLGHLSCRVSHSLRTGGAIRHLLQMGSVIPRLDQESGSIPLGRTHVVSYLFIFSIGRHMTTGCPSFCDISTLDTQHLDLLTH